MRRIPTVFMPFDKYWKGKEEWWMSFELVGRAGESHFYLRLPKDFQHMMESAIYGQYPEAEITEVDDYLEHFPEVLPNKEIDLSGFEEMLTESELSSHPDLSFVRRSDRGAPPRYDCSDHGDHVETER